MSEGDQRFWAHLNRLEILCWELERQITWNWQAARSYCRVSDLPEPIPTGKPKTYSTDSHPILKPWILNPCKGREILVLLFFCAWTFLWVPFFMDHPVPGSISYPPLTISRHTPCYCFIRRAKPPLWKQLKLLPRTDQDFHPWVRKCWNHSAANTLFWSKTENVSQAASCLSINNYLGKFGTLPGKVLNFSACGTDDYGQSAVVHIG